MPIDPAGPSKGVVVLLGVATPLLPFLLSPLLLYPLSFALSVCLSGRVLQRVRSNPFDAPPPDRKRDRHVPLARMHATLGDLCSSVTMTAMSLFCNNDMESFLRGRRGKFCFSDNILCINNV